MLSIQDVGAGVGEDGGAVGVGPSDDGKRAVNLTVSWYATKPYLRAIRFDGENPKTFVFPATNVYEPAKPGPPSSVIVN